MRAVLFRLSKAGYGTIREVREMDVREVLQLLHYETFLAEYEDKYVELNKE